MANQEKLVKGMRNVQPISVKVDSLLTWDNAFLEGVKKCYLMQNLSYNLRVASNHRTGNKYMFAQLFPLCYGGIFSLYWRLFQR